VPVRTYLVTGGAGFIGSHVVENLLKKAVSVRVLDDLSTGSRENLAGFEGLPGRLEFLEGDIRIPGDVRRAVTGVDGVFHQAALRSVPRSVDDPLSSNDVNVTGTLQLLIACRDAKVRRVVYASSSSVYGDDPTLPKVEDLRPSPVSPYAATKLMGEYYCQIYTRLYGVETVSLRYFNVFGPRQSPESKYAAVVPRFLAAAIRGEPLEVHGDGQQSRDFTYIDNVVAANLLAMEAAKASGNVFNVACGARYSVLDVAAAIAKGLGRSVRLEHQPARPGDVRDTLADISRARTELGYEPRVGFEEGIRRTCEHFAAQSAGGKTHALRVGERA
jgi:nucleoside-diphosphate-sugar epimerase